MAFDRLQDLGEERFRAILNALMTGTPAMQVARTIQQEWKEFQDVQEKTLTQQLNRLRIVAAEGAFGKKVANAIQKGATPQVKMLEGVSSSVIERMEELAEIERERVLWLREKEKAMPMPVQSMAQSMNASFNDYSRLLLDIQKLRFDLGLDKFQGIVSTVKGMTTTVVNPDGSGVQQQVFQAINVLEDIFKSRNIPDIEVKPV